MSVPSWLLLCIQKTHIDDAAQSSDGIGPIHGVTADRCGVLHDTACDHDDIFGCVGQLFDDQIHHLPQTCIFVLK